MLICDLETRSERWGLGNECRWGQNEFGLGWSRKNLMVKMNYMG